jgi:hypothetical protein
LLNQTGDLCSMKQRDKQNGYGCRPWDKIDQDGDPAAHYLTLRFRKGGRTLAVATIFRGRESLAAELAKERGQAPLLVRLHAPVGMPERDVFVAITKSTAAWLRGALLNRYAPGDQKQIGGREYSRNH